MKIIQGQGVSKGIEQGTIYFYHRAAAQVEMRTGADEQEERARLERAKERTAQQLSDMAEKAREEAGDEAAVLFETHAMFLEDEDYTGAMDELLAQGFNAEYAVDQAGQEFAAMLASMDDPYMQARAADIKDVARRILDNLTGAAAGGIDSEEPVLLAADDLAPSETLQLDKSKILGFVTRGGSGNSHTAILARTMGIPAICGAGEALLESYQGRMSYIDGETGQLIIDPDPITLAALKEKFEKQAELKTLLETMKGQEDVTLDGSGSTTGSNVWYALPAARREAIGLILLYSNQMWDKSVSVATTTKDSNPNVPLRIATQFLIYEIVCGLRNPTTFESNSTNECGTSGDIFYNAGEASVPYFAPKYNALVDTIQAAKKIPSFTASSSGSAPTITLNGEETSVTDSNGVLSNFSFTDGSGAEFYKSGNTLYITQTGDISESAVFKATRNLPSASSSTFNIWYMSGSTYQTTVSLANASTGSLNAYFKLKAVPQVGNISLTKTTEDGQNLSGWRFGIYSNSACTNLVSGPHSTNSSGRFRRKNFRIFITSVKLMMHCGQLCRLACALRHFRLCPFVETRHILE